MAEQYTLFTLPDTQEQVQVPYDPEKGETAQTAYVNALQHYQGGKFASQQDAPAAQQDAPTAQPSAPSQSSAPPQPGTLWDMVKSGGSGAMKALTGLSSTVTQGVAQQLTPSMQLAASLGNSSAMSVRDKLDAAMKALTQNSQDASGANYQPATTAGKYTKAGAEGLTEGVATGGRSLLQAALGVLSGTFGQVMNDWASDPQGQDNTLARAAGRIAPYVASATVQSARNPGPAIKMFRDALERQEPGSENIIRGMQNAAEEINAPVPVWANAPADSRLFAVGAEAAKQPTSKLIQARLQDLRGDVSVPGHAAAYELERAADEGNVADPDITNALASRLRSIDTLRNADAGIQQVTGAPQEEMGHLALGVGAIDPLVNHALGPVKAAFPSLALARGGALRGFFKGPKLEAMDQLGAETDYDKLRELALANPRAPLYRSLFQGAYASQPGDIQNPLAEPGDQRKQ